MAGLELFEQLLAKLAEEAIEGGFAIELASADGRTTVGPDRSELLPRREEASRTPLDRRSPLRHSSTASKSPSKEMCALSQKSSKTSRRDFPLRSPRGATPSRRLRRTLCSSRTECLCERPNSPWLVPSTSSLQIGPSPTSVTLIPLDPVSGLKLMFISIEKPAEFSIGMRSAVRSGSVACFGVRRIGPRIALSGRSRKASKSSQFMPDKYALQLLEQQPVSFVAKDKVNTRADAAAPPVEWSFCGVCQPLS
jgi:hypothetical protein